jgi:hypothetical protein
VKEVKEVKEDEEEVDGRQLKVEREEAAAAGITFVPAWGAAVLRPYMR